MGKRNPKNEKICVIGLGYIGLPTASLLANRGFDIHGVDISIKAVETINSGKAHIVEPDLDVLVRSAVQSGRLKANLKPAEADVFIIAVPTPFKDNHKPDLKYVESAVTSILPFVKPGNAVVLESTSPVGTTELIAEILFSNRKDLKLAQQKGDGGIAIAYCPERVLPGAILKELIENDRIVGGINSYSAQVVSEFYGKFVTGKLLITNSRTAEMSKLTENAYRDVNIAFANELNRISDKLGIDVWELISLSNHHPRVNILRPGPGVGGHCIAVDPWFIIDSAKDESKLLTIARNVNDSQPHYVLNKIKAHYEDLKAKGKSIALLGLAYKPNIDDMRESPALDVTKLVAQSFSGMISVVEPYLEELPSEIQGNSNLKLVSLETAVSEAGLVVVLVNHDYFKTLKNLLPKETKVLDIVGTLRV